MSKRAHRKKSLFFLFYAYPKLIDCKINEFISEIKGCNIF